MKTVEYHMPYLMAKDLLKSKPSNLTPQQFLCKVVNETFGIKGYCSRVIY